MSNKNNKPNSGKSPYSSKPPAHSDFHAMVWTRGRDGELTYFNRAWYDFAGCPEGADPDYCWKKAINKDDFDNTLKVIKSTLAQKSEFTVQYRLRRHDGQDRWIADCGAPRYDAQGEFAGYTGSCIDIQDLKTGESKLENYTEDLELMIQDRIYALHEKENQLKYFMESLPNMAWIKDKNGVYMLVNSACARFMGSDAESIIGKTDFDLIPEVDAKRHTAEDIAVILEGEPLTYDKKVVADGGFIYLQILKRPIYNHVDEIIGLAGVAIDITERKKAELILKNANEELERQVAERTQNLNHEKNMIELFYNLVPSGVFTSDDKCVITSWNKSAEIITGYTAADVIGKLCPFNISRQCFNKPINLNALYENQFIVKEGEFVTKDGRQIYVLKKATTLKNEAGTIFGRIESFEDITKRREAEMEIKQARLEAERANKMKSDFLANMSHEIRTPMNSIIGFADMLFNTKLTDEQNYCLGYIKTSSQALLSLINNILDFSKIEAGKLEIESLEFDLNRVLYEVAGIITPLLDAKKLRVDIANTFALKHYLIGDPNRIRQIILNFATNAIKFSREGAVKILFELISETEADATFTLGVEDRGIGVAPEKIEQIFSPFVQADSSTTRRFGGTGLGLAISNQLVKLMGAEKIFVESRVGFGSKFYFTLKLKKGAVIKGEPVNRPSINLKEAGDREKFRAKVLLAEDNPANTALITKLMKILGHDITIAENGLLAVEAACKEKFDLIFMDVQMPEMDGIEATRKIREAGVEIPIVAMTAAALKDDIDSCLAAGMNAYTSKPINVAEIQGLIKKYAEDRPR